MNPTHFVGMSGSLCAASYNTGLLRAAFDDLPEGVTAEITSLDGIPFYNQGVERTVGRPESVDALRLDVGGLAERVDDAVRSITEMGYRTLIAHTAADAVQIMGNRAVAGVVLDEGLGTTTRRAIENGSGDAEVVTVEEPSVAGIEIDDALRYASDPR